MKQALLCLFFLAGAPAAFAQNKSLQKSWIKTKVENLSAREMDPDTLYTRYTFTKSEVKFSFYPGWDDYRQTWSSANKDLTIGFDTYRIEELTDTSLVYALDGFRRFHFLAEEYLVDQLPALDSIGMYRGKPLYKANKIITPRYKKGGLANDVQNGLDAYKDKKAAYFAVTFVVTDEGKVGDVQVINSIGEGFDREFTKQLLKTSKNWRPAVYRGKPVQTQMLYEIKYLDSIVPFNSGKLN